MLLIPALVILLEAVVAAIVAAGLHLGPASAVVGGVTLLIGIALFAIGSRRLQLRLLVPSRTLRQLQRDAALASHELRYSDDIRNRAA